MARTSRSSSSLRAEGDERLGPVEGLGDAWWLVEVHGPQILDGGCDLPGQLLLGLGDPEA